MTDLRLMSREFLTEFIELYRQNECLWKIESKDYSNKQKKNAAYTVLIEKLKEIDPVANKDMVKKKINSLRTCFRKELKKYNASLKRGSGTEDAHKPKLWYFDLLIFLNDQGTPRQDRDTINEHYYLDSEEYNILEEINNQTENADMSDVDTVTTPSISRPASRTTSISKKKKRDRAVEVLEVIAESLQSNHNIAATQNEPVGRYASYGKHIAQELEDLPPKMAIYCKKIINDALYEAQVGNLTAQSRLVSKPEPPSTNTSLEPINNYGTSPPGNVR